MGRTEEAVVGHMRDWAERFTAGRMKWRSAVRTPLRAGERMGGFTEFVSAHQEGPGAPAPLTGSHRVRFARESSPDGLGVVTSERFIIWHSNNVAREWSWASWHTVALDVPSMAVVLRDADNPDQGTAVLWNPPTSFLFPPSLRVAMEKMLRIEGAFAASVGELDAWLANLPSRFEKAAGA